MAVITSGYLPAVLLQPIKTGARHYAPSSTSSRISVNHPAAAYTTLLMVSYVAHKYPNITDHPIMPYCNLHSAEKSFRFS